MKENFMENKIKFIIIFFVNKNYILYIKLLLLLKLYIKLYEYYYYFKFYLYLNIIIIIFFKYLRNGKIKITN